MSERTGWRWLVSDLDGTMVDRRLGIPPANAAAVRRFRRAGGEVLLATGRSETSALRYHHQLGLHTPLIVYNGARVIGADGTAWYERSLGDAWPRLRDTLLPALPPDVGAVAFAGGGAHTVRPAAALADYARRDGIRLLPAEALPAGPVTKLMLIAERPDGLDPVQAAVADATGEVAMVRSEPTYLEVLPPGVDKGAALRWLARRCGVRLSDVAAIGDNPNDRSLLAAAGLGAAVADGDPSLRAAADLVVAACDDGAVADLVGRLLGGSEAGWEPRHSWAV